MGRHTEYDANVHPQRVIELAQEGKSIVQIAVAMEVSRATLYRWAEANREFGDTLKEAQEISQAFWEEVLVGNATYEGANAQHNTTSLIFLMKCRFPDYREKQQIEHSGSLTFETQAPEI